jgi:hypothetical protein
VGLQSEHKYAIPFLPTKPAVCYSFGVSLGGFSSKYFLLVWELWVPIKTYQDRSFTYLWSLSDGVSWLHEGKPRPWASSPNSGGSNVSCGPFMYLVAVTPRSSWELQEWPRTEPKTTKDSRSIEKAREQSGWDCKTLEERLSSYEDYKPSLEEFKRAARIKEPRSQLPLLRSCNSGHLSWLFGSGS